MAAGPSPFAMTTKPTAGTGPITQFVIATPGQRDASLVTSRPTVANMRDPKVWPRVLTSGSQINQAAVGPAEQAVPPGMPFVAGSQLNRARSGAPWPRQIPAEISDGWFVGQPQLTGPVRLAELAHHNTPSSYGLMTSVANFGYRHRVYAPGVNLRVVKTGKGSVIAGIKSMIALPLTSVESGSAEVAGYPGITQVMPGQRLYNNLLPIVWGARVENPVRGGSLGGQIQPNFVVGVFNTPMQFTAAGNATLSMKGEVLL